MFYGNGIDLQADLRNTQEDRVLGWMIDVNVAW